VPDLTPSNSPTSFRERDEWMRAVLASDLPHVAVRIAIRIALHLRVNTGRCDPAYTTLAAETHVPERSVYRLVALLEHAGWIAIQRTRGRHSNQYVLLNPANSMAGLNPAEARQNPDNAAVSGLANPDPGDNPTLPNRASNPANMVADKKRRTTKRKAGGESDSPGLRFTDEKQEAGEETNRPPNRAPSAGGQRKKTEGGARATDDGAAFSRFWAAYPRRVAKEAARRAFAAAIKRGADAEALIAGAARYAAERRDQEIRFTKHPATWINGGCWEDEPPGGAVIDQQGNVVAFEQPQARRGSREKTWAEVGAELLAELEERDRGGTRRG
jgi:hypothetical protein